MLRTLLIFGYLFCNPCLAQWTSLNDVPFTSSNDGSAVWNNTVYVLSNVDRALYIYDAQADSFASVPATWFVRASQIGIFAIDGKIYASGARQQGQATINDLWYAYDIASETWEQKASFPFQPFGLTSLRLFKANDSIYLIDTNFEEFYRYDISTDAWVPLSFTFPNQVFRFQPSTFTVNNKAFLGATLDVAANSTDTWYEYDPASNSWSAISAINTANNPRELRCVEDSGFAYCGTGRLQVPNGSTITSNKLFRYDPANDVWLELEDAPYSAAGAFIFALNDELYFGGGADGLNFFTDLFKRPLSQLSINEITPNKNEVVFYDSKTRSIVSRTAKIEEIQIYNLEGKKLAQRRINSKSFRLNYKTMLKGVYIAKVILASKGVENIKFIID